MIEDSLKMMLFDFFKEAREKFEGRLDEGKITVKELRDFIDEWMEE